MRDTKQSQAEPVRLARADTRAPQGLELRHLRYFAAVADTGTFTHAAEQVFIVQPTLSQQIGRLEQLVGTPLLRRGRDGVRLTAAGAVLLYAARDVLARVDHGVSQTRLPRRAGTGDMGRVSFDGQPLTATAALAWNGDLPRPLQQILFDTADGLARPAPASPSRAG